MSFSPSKTGSWTDVHNEGNLSAHALCQNSPAEMHAAYTLRYQYFVLRRQWVAPKMDCVEIEYDRYDEIAHHFGVFDGSKLLGYLRALPWTETHGFMLEHEFSCLFPQENLRSLNRTKALEVSRLVLSPDLPPENCQNVVELLLKSLYHLAKQQQKTIIYMVVEESWVKPFVRRFKLPLQQVGIPYRFPDGTKTVAAMTDIRELEKLFAEKYPEKFQWYQKV